MTAWMNAGKLDFLEKIDKIDKPLDRNNQEDKGMDWNKINDKEK